MDLHEGVIVCTLNHRILLYNKRALELLRICGDIGLDRSLFRFLAQQPILHALSRLANRLAQGRYESRLGGHTVPFVGSTTNGKHTLEGRMSLIVESGQTPTGYVLSFEDYTDELAALALRDRLLREATEGLRQPVGNLRAAAEILAGGALSADEQAGFQRVLLQESQQLGARLETLAAQYRNVITGHWPLSDIYTSNLLQTLSDRLREQSGITATIVGLPQWLHGDSYSLVEFLHRVIVRLSRFAETASFQLEAVAGEGRVYLDVIWSGPVLPAAKLDGWLDEQLEDVLGGLSLREILERHKTDIWSLPDRPGQARLRLPLPPPARPAIVQDIAGQPSRPEFYDFDLLRRPLDLGELGRGRSSRLPRCVRYRDDRARSIRRGRDRRHRRRAYRQRPNSYRRVVRANGQSAALYSQGIDPLPRHHRRNGQGQTAAGGGVAVSRLCRRCRAGRPQRRFRSEVSEIARGGMRSRLRYAGARHVAVVVPSA